MKQSTILFALISTVLCMVGTTAFAPSNANVAKAFGVSKRGFVDTSLNVFSGDEERVAITRDTEPEDFFST
jgi:hypothetical protein